MGSASNVGSAPFKRPTFGSTLQTEHQRARMCRPLKGVDPTFEADPIGRRLECLPKKGININFTLFLKVFLMGPRGPQGLINQPQGPGDEKKCGVKFLKNPIFGPEVSTIFGIPIFRFLASKLNRTIQPSMIFQFSGVPARILNLVNMGLNMGRRN